MGRTFAREGIVRAVSAADASFPGTMPASPITTAAAQTAGIWATEGATVLIVDIDQDTTSTANTYEVLAWNRTAAKWFSVLKITPASGTQDVRTSISSWAADFAWVNATGATVKANIYVQAPAVI